jgi:phenylacetate-CoA ligase
MTMHDWRMSLYWQLPVALQELGISLYARRLDRLYYGPGFAEWCKICENSAAWSRKAATDWQNEALERMVALAATKVPYYRRRWSGVNWKTIRSVQDLSTLPILEKSSLRQHESEFIAETFDPKSLWIDRTSGTTGVPLTLFWPKSMLPKWWAIDEMLIRGPVGVSQHLSRAMMGGRPVIKGNTSKPPFWRFNSTWNQLYLSSYHVAATTAQYYAAALLEYDSRWMTGYGSAIAALANFALNANVNPIPLKAIIVSGDTLLPAMRVSIERFFQCKCFDNYGQTEAVCLAIECSQGRMHIIPLVGVLEILREDGSPCRLGEVGEMVATGLLNDAMPLIRYRLGDRAAWSKDQSCSCGNPQPILSDLEGRVDDCLHTADGRRIGRVSRAIKGNPRIQSAQIVQDRPDHAYLLVQPGEGYKLSDAVEIKEDILNRIGLFNLTIVEVPEIPRTPRGKTIFVVRLADRPSLRPTYEKLINYYGSSQIGCSVGRN